MLKNCPRLLEDSVLEHLAEVRESVLNIDLSEAQERFAMKLRGSVRVCVFGRIPGAAVDDANPGGRP